MAKHTILFLAANPSGTSALALGEEARDIQAELERSGYRDNFNLETRWAAQPLDLLRELRKLKPSVVHFSGHGDSSSADTCGARRTESHDGLAEPDESDHEQRSRLFFQAADGQAQVVTTAALRDTFGAAGSSVKVVVLNACYSEAQAEALRVHVDCVVGMRGTLGDQAARRFAIGFYGGLGEGESVAAAFRQGCAAIGLDGFRDGDRPQLKVRDGLGVTSLVLDFPVHHAGGTMPRHDDACTISSQGSGLQTWHDAIHPRFPPSWLLITGLVLGGIAVIVTFAVILFRPTIALPAAVFYVDVIRAVVALGGAGLAMSLSGLISRKHPIYKLETIGAYLATVSVIMFVILYYLFPAEAMIKVPIIGGIDSTIRLRGIDSTIRLESFDITRHKTNKTGEQPRLDLVFVNEGPRVAVLHSISAQVLSGNREQCLPILTPSSTYFIDISRGFGSVKAANELLPNRAERILIDLFRGCYCCTSARVHLSFDFSNIGILVYDADL